MYWVYFFDLSDVYQFVDWVEVKGYLVELVVLIEDGKLVVWFLYEGMMMFVDIMCYMIVFNCEVCVFGGDYDGWEISVEQVG